MKNVHLRVADNAVVGVRQLRGEVIPTARGGSAVLDSTRSFSIRITSGTVALASADLGVILNRFVFGYKGSPLRNLRVRMSGDQLVQTGIMRKGVDLKFEITSALSLTDSGLIRLRPTKVRVLGVNGQALLHALGLKLDDMLDLSGSAAARVKGDDIYLDPTKILPALRSRVASRRCEWTATSLVQEFVRLPEDSVFSGYARADSAGSELPVLSWWAAALRAARDARYGAADSRSRPIRSVRSVSRRVQQAARGGILAEPDGSVAAGVLP
jgi:hypothetical protein